jgi:phosphatidylinositol 4-phosphatase
VILGDSDTSPAPGVEKSEPQILSHVQTRGSVPVFWAEINHLSYVPKLQIRGVDAAIGAARKHFDEQISLYGDNYLVNLVNQKGREERVKRAYETMVRNLVSSAQEEVEASAETSERFHEIEPTEKRRKEDRLHYTYFDFHHECRNMRWHRAELLLDQLKDALEKQGYYHATIKGDQVDILREQSSVVRTNCMDCLDRTNVVQSMLARYALTRQLQNVGVLTAAEATKQFNHFELMFRAGKCPHFRDVGQLTPHSLGG